MGRRGPAATPTPLRAVPTRPPGLEPQPRPIVGDPRPPGWLEGEALRLWHDWAPLAVDMGTLTAVDVERFAQGCAAAADYQAARRMMSQRGRTQGGQKGARIVSTAVQLMERAERRFDTFCSRFGFDPSARATLKVTPPTAYDPDSPWDV
jgi:P27 family predicted phage terminase small subunit